MIDLTEFPPVFRCFRHWLLLPLVIGTCLTGCGGNREHAVAIIADLETAESSLQRNAITLMRLREGKPDTDYGAILDSLAKEYDTIKRCVAKAERNAEDLEGIIKEADLKIYVATHPSAAAGPATTAGDPAQRATALRTALTELAHSRDEVNTLSGIYMPRIYNIVRDLAQSRGNGEIGERKIRIASTVDFGDDLAAALVDLNAKLKVVSGLLVEP